MHSLAARDDASTENNSIFVKRDGTKKRRAAIRRPDTGGRSQIDWIFKRVCRTNEGTISWSSTVKYGTLLDVVQ